jgi:hypothetical protein
MTNKERIHFKIGLTRSSDVKHPKFRIHLDNNLKIDSTVSTAAGVTEFFEFDVELDEGEHYLSIDLINKSPDDTKLNDAGEIVEDLLLNIVSIEIDEIDIGFLSYTLSTYNPVYPDSYIDNDQKKITTIKNCVNLGWNGTWKLPFTSPVYVWLLENI